jgi:hypothetical protein
MILMNRTFRLILMNRTFHLIRKSLTFRLNLMYQKNHYYQMCQNYH